MLHRAFPNIPWQKSLEGEGRAWCDCHRASHQQSAGGAHRVITASLLLAEFVEPA